MREVVLPISQKFSATLDVDAIKKSIVRGERLNLGTIVVNDKIFSEIGMARRNGGTILYATTSIEQKIESLLLDYFMGPFVRYDPRRSMFELEILKSTALSFNTKKELVVKVITENELLQGKKKNTVQKHLKSIMEWRNAFAHGTLVHNSKIGCILQYYSGHARKLNLSDEYWNEVEICFKECDALLDEVRKKLNNPPDASGQSKRASK